MTSTLSNIDRVIEHLSQTNRIKEAIKNSLLVLLPRLEALRDHIYIAGWSLEGYTRTSVTLRVKYHVYLVDKYNIEEMSMYLVNDDLIGVF